MGCGGSRINHTFSVHLLSFKQDETEKESYSLKEVTKEKLQATEKDNLPELILNCKTQAFLDYFETAEQIKDCAFCLYFDEKMKKKFYNYKEASKYNPYKQIKDRLG